MTFPIPNYTLIKVRGHFVDLAKAARLEASYGLTGPVQFIPTPIVAINQGSGQIIEMKPFVVFPDPADGYFEVMLPSTDDPDLVPQEWNYKVVEPTGRTYYLVVPYDTPLLNLPGDPDHQTQVIDLVNVVPDPEADAGTIQLLQGLPGRSVNSVVLDGSHHLIVTYSDTATQDAGLVMGVTSVNTRAGDVTLTKTDVGLSAVDNVSAASLRDRSTHTGTQAISTVSGLQSALDGKAATSHTHATSQVTGLDTALAAKPDSADVDTIDVLTQAAYDAIGTKDSRTLYVVVG